MLIAELLEAQQQQHQHHPTLLRQCRERVPTVAAEVAPAPAPPAKAPTIFASRAKFTPRCPVWLKSSRSRSNLLKSFTLEEVYDADYSSIQIATPKAAATQVRRRRAPPPPAFVTHGGDGSGAALDGAPSGPHKLVIKSFKKSKLLQRPDLQQKLKMEWDLHTALLDHPNVIQAYLATEDEGSVGLFMEYAGESDAYSYLTAKQRLSLREDDARQLMHDVLSALQHMHDLGLAAGRSQAAAAPGGAS
ncbi:hypothetical protein MNEG_13988 [Monoraphidium neglectum]|uniref:Protein kinase domain-containing protein n=1 Tax=Monoraphidium neglectum TaxID=145388 RepID=A0A0D2KDR7_9CHLO|nr:hypothetical protein MNEG_13988 [Monoraphidium neglectum]KIY93973.1 hypothetical protein MNEG_13988 [Monoraphidium neglectum]|eukprot:XP_013892993.1 hypothetical protein MNEG_13988 [Monoraphidium neglectum]